MPNKKTELTEEKISEMIDYSMTHSKDDTARRYHIKITRLNSILEERNVIRPSHQEQIRNTCLIKYGDANYNNLEKCRQTKLERYGDPNYNNTEKRKKTKLNSSYSRIDNFDNIVDATQKCDNIKPQDDSNTKKSSSWNNPEKRRETCMKKYGTPSASGNKEIREKIKQTCIERYGVDNPWKSEEIKKKIRDTQIKNHGGIGFASDELFENYQNKMLQEYGVRYFCMHEKCINATNGMHSKPNDSFETLLVSNGIQIDCREFVINTYRYDFKIGNVLIEIDPYATHNTLWSIHRDPIKDTYHKEKSLVAKQFGYRCVHIFDWDDINKILMLLLPRPRLFARKCIIKEVSVDIAKDFLNSYHLQGYIEDTVRIGLYYNNVLVSIMTFGTPRYNKNYNVELLRYCSNCEIIGGAEKLFTYFLKTYHPNSIISYCDLSKFVGNVYEKLGFTLLRTTIGIHWYNPKTHRHITDNLLRQYGFDKLLGKEYGYYGKYTSNIQLLIDHGFVRICDAGQATYVYTVTD